MPTRRSQRKNLSIIEIDGFKGNVLPANEKSLVTVVHVGTAHSDNATRTIYMHKHTLTHTIHVATLTMPLNLM